MSIQLSNSIINQERIHLLFESEEQVIELMIEKEFSDVPIMKKIAVCESGMRQFDEKGKVIMGKAKEKGLFQIHPVWLTTMEKLGIDVDTIQGNIKAARYILNVQGLSAWTCWNMVK